jgi:hypothetical protein
VEVKFHEFFNVILDKGEWSDCRFGCFICGQKVQVHDVYWLDGYMVTLEPLWKRETEKSSTISGIEPKPFIP